MRSTKPMSNMEAVNAAAVEGVITATATRVGMGGGSLYSVYGWLTSNGAAVLIGILVTILGFIVNYIYQRRREKREIEQAKFLRELQVAEERRREELHQAQLAALIPKIPTP